MKNLWVLIVISIFLSGCATMKNKAPGKEILYAGTFSDSGLYVFEFDRETLRLKLLQNLPAIKPSFLAIHPSRKFLYSVNRVSIVPDKDWGSVATYAIAPDSGKLTLLNEQSTLGKDPNHISLDKTGEWAFVTNFRGDNIAVFPVKRDGTLGEATDTKDHAETGANGEKIAPHPHSIIRSPDNNYFYVQNLGIDKIITYTLDRKTGKLQRVNKDILAPKGTGPRHLIVHPEGEYAYLAEELSSTVSSYQLNTKTGELVFKQRLSTLPDGYSGTTKVADIQIHPNRKFLYVSNRGHDSIATYKIDFATGQLGFLKTQAALGEHPRNILIDPEGKYMMLANEKSGNVVVFDINPENGDITPTGLKINVPAATCLQLLKLR